MSAELFLIRLTSQEFKRQSTAILAPLIVKSGAVLDGEFVFSSGISSPIKIEGDYILQDPEVFFQVCRFMEAWLLRHYRIPDVFVGVVRGGVPYAQYLAQTFGREWAARLGKDDPGKVQFEVGEIKPGADVLVVEDVFTFGGNINYCIQNLGNQQVLGALAIYSYEMFPQGVIQSLIGWSDLRLELLKNPSKENFVTMVDKWRERHKRAT